VGEIDHLLNNEQGIYLVIMKIHKNKRNRTIIIEDKWSEKETLDALTHLNSVLCDLQRKSDNPKSNPKIFSVDWDNLEDVDKLFLKIQGRRQDLKKNNGLLKRPTDTQIFQKRWDAIQTILNEDISFLYEDVTSLDKEKKYYVYAHCDTNNKLDISKKNPYHVLAASLNMRFMPFYIGKGTGDRYMRGDRNRNYSKIVSKKITEIDKIIIKSDLDEAESLQFESKLIDLFGLAIHGGFLINIDEGYKRDHRRFCYVESLRILRGIENIL
jgi:hypothetical protein